MKPAILEWLKLVAVPVTSAVIAAFLAAFLATRRTKKETRWQSKYDAYQRILASVEDIRYWAEETYADNMLLPSIGQARLDEARNRYEEAKRVLSSHVYIGGLIVCDAARTRLDTMLAALATEEFDFHDDAGDPNEFPTKLAKHGKKVREIASEHIPHILKLAKKDLK